MWEKNEGKTIGRIWRSSKLDQPAWHAAVWNWLPIRINSISGWVISILSKNHGQTQVGKFALYVRNHSLTLDAKLYSICSCSMRGVLSGDFSLERPMTPMYDITFCRGMTLPPRKLSFTKRGNLTLYCNACAVNPGDSMTFQESRSLPGLPDSVIDP